MKPAFPPEAHFEGGGAYEILPFRFEKWRPGAVLLSNDAGDFLELDRADFEAFHSNSLTPDLPVYRELKSRHFLVDEVSNVALDLLALKIRTRKQVVQELGRLQIVVVTLRCDHSCQYCQVSRVNEGKSLFDMSEETAALVVSQILATPTRDIKVEFQGGEALLAFGRIRQIVEALEGARASAGKTFSYVIATNLNPLTPEMLEFCCRWGVVLSTSLDGPEDLHVANRPSGAGSSFATFERHLDQARECLGAASVSALLTLTHRSLGRPKEIVDEYVRLGFSSIFLRPLSPYGFAYKSGLVSRYEADDYLRFFGAALDCIIELNRSGVRLVEVMSQILASRIVTPFPGGYVDLQSPAVAGLSALVYNYDGGIYASDESRMLAAMGDETFRMGNVRDADPKAFLRGDLVDRLLDGSIVESLPGCTDCVFLPYCGSDPVYNWHTQRDFSGFRPTSQFCRRQLGLFRILFQKLLGEDDFARELIESWAWEAVA